MYVARLTAVCESNLRVLPQTEGETHQSYKFVLDESGDLLLGFLYGHVTGGLYGQVQLPLPLLRLLVGGEVRPPDRDARL